MQRVLVKDIIAFLGKDIIRVFGNVNDKIVDNVSDVNHVSETTLDWIAKDKKNKQIILSNSKAQTILIDPDVELKDEMIATGKCFIIVENPKKILIKVINQYFYSKLEAKIDPTAIIHPEAIIGRNNYIGPHCYVGKCVIGDNNIIHSNVCIYDRTTIGNNNTIHSGALICVDGLGCIREKDGSLTEFPQLGGVIIKNNCYIGGNVHIASGSLSNTIIGNGCKLNGMTFIGSNDILEDNVWITGSTMLCGSVHIGQNTNIFSHVVIRDWVNVGADTTIGMGAVVTKNVPDSETWIGCPAKKIEIK